MNESILKSIKKVLNLPDEYKAFDQDVIMFINTVFGTLNQLGVGPEQGFAITDDSTTWEAFLEGDPRLNPIQTYVYLRVRLLFDPPTVGYHAEALKEQIKELEWRLNAQREDVKWTSPTPPSASMSEE